MADLYKYSDEELQKRNEWTDKYFNRNIVRNTLNSLRNKNWAFFDRHYVYPVEKISDEVKPKDTKFLFYDYMHIRMKP